MNTTKRLGRNTVILPNRPAVVAGAALAGKKEGEGPLGKLYDAVVPDDLFGEESWEKAEQRFFFTAASTCLNKAGLRAAELDVLLGGDLLNQIMASSLAARELGAPFLGLYGACSTMAESLLWKEKVCFSRFLQVLTCLTLKLTRKILRNSSKQ